MERHDVAHLVMSVQAQAMAVVEKARAVYGPQPASLSLGMGRAICAVQKAATGRAAVTKTYC